MIFNSIEFALFLPIVFLLYWFVFNRNYKLQNIFVVVVSYIFYGWWDWRFLFLIAFTSFCSWASGIAIERSRGNAKKLICGANIVVNLTILGIFKYYNFFVTEFTQLVFGGNSESWLINVILPVGISFYTFQALSYSIDVFRGNIKATRDCVQFFAYVSFFPQLVAGPIERATNLLPQFARERHFDYAQAIDGLRQMLWGFFKKMVIADNCAKAVDTVWANYENLPASALAIAAILFAFQIYGDFSGYSDIAIGCAKLFGISLKKNFHYPYFSRDIAEFWRHWHISLNTWFRDYLYIPLGGSRAGMLKTLRNTFIIFAVCGLWHGANWTYIVWGLFNAALFIPLLLTKRNRKNLDIVASDAKFFPSIKEFFQVAGTFIAVVFGWIIFRAPTITDAWNFTKRMLCSGTWLEMPHDLNCPRIIVPALAFLILAEWLSRRNEFALEHVPAKNQILRWAFYGAFMFFILQYDGGATQFIYFQF